MSAESSRLYLDNLIIPAARLGDGNPLFYGTEGAAANIVRGVDPSIPEADRKFVGYGAVKGSLPYQPQEDYDRVRRKRSFRVAVLENRFLRATFLLEYGGRLWSLLYKPENRDLLYVNPVFQPANLAIRNAWFSGGVEWNFGWPGHSPLTCSPVFAAQLSGSDDPVLRLYEWERVRRMPYQIDAYLSDDAPLLFVRMRLVNPHSETIPVYWWSNIAVPEVEGGRVLAPATESYTFAYDKTMRRTDIPLHDSVDVSYPKRNRRAADYFFRIPDGRRPWIASLDPSGRGMFQTSTYRLRGRKMFVWGNSQGGGHWQDFLSIDGERYLEIQAGLARTQAECLPMPAGAEWSWTEAYGPMEADAATVHGSDWQAACAHVEEKLDGVIHADALEAEHLRTVPMAESVAPKTLHRGSGWGYLEAARRTACGEENRMTNLVFDAASIGAPERPWLQLVNEGTFPQPDPAEPPAAWMVQSQWRELLEAAATSGGSDHWATWLHLGVMYFSEGRLDDAQVAWEKSRSRLENGWAWRNLGILAMERRDFATASSCYERAWNLGPGSLRLAVERGRAMITDGRSRDWLDLLPSLPTHIRENGRVRLLEARAALSTGDLARVEKIIADNLEVADIRESETEPTDIWFELMERKQAIAQTAGAGDIARGKTGDIASHVSPRDSSIPHDFPSAPVPDVSSDAYRAKIRADFPPPRGIDFRMSQ